MIKIKNKFYVVLLCVFSISVLLFISETPITSFASAITTPKYKMEISYSTTTTNGTGSGASKTTSTGKGYSVNFQVSSNEYQSASMVIYGSSSSGTGNFPLGSYINSSTINLVMTSTCPQGSITVTNSLGTQVDSGEKSVTMTGLSDGTYNVSLFFGYGAWTTSSRSGTSQTTSGTTSFTVDCTYPTISGASSSLSGKFTNQSFTVSASDSGSGVENLYMLSPSASSYTACGTSIKVPSGSENGLYKFYAKDNAGNSTSTYYVYYDTSKPTLTTKTSDGTDFTQYTNQSFSCSASDVGSGIKSIEYKTPSKTTWTTYKSGTSISNTATNGCYQFRATDNAGNISDTVTVYLDTINPTGILYGGTKVVSNGGTTNANYIKFVPNDDDSGINCIYVKKPSTSLYSAYTSGSQLTTNGIYSFYCIDNAGNSSQTYTIRLDNVAPTITCSQTDFFTTINTDFTVKASDNLVGVKIYYKTPSMSSYLKALNSSYNVTAIDALEGKYYFYAIDNAGNTSETKWIELIIDNPVAIIERDENTNKYRITWEKDGTGMLNDKPYAKSSWISEEGEYVFVLTNSNNRSTSYNFTIDHCYVPVQTISPTCIKQGYTLAECITCKQQIKTDVVSACGHSYTTHKVNPTCTTDGYTVYTCKSCGYSYQDNIVARLGHDYIETNINATCLENGGIKYTCSRCGYNYMINLTNKIGHEFSEIKIESTCENEGCIEHKCNLCGYSYKTDIVPALGHLYNTEIIKTATCTTEGNRHYVCERCHNEYNAFIPCLGHQFDMKDNIIEDETIRTYTCTVCGYSYSENLGDKYEVVSNYVEFLFERYSPYMIWVLIGTAGVWSLVMGIMIIIATKNEEKEKARKMVKNYVIGLIVIFVIVAACPYLVKGIASIVT